MATNTSLRPRIRPDIDKQMTESLRPKSREEGLIEKQKRIEEKNKQTKEFGNLEYRAELEPQLSWNPIARLGYDPDKHKIVNTQGVADLYGTAMFINRLGGGERSVRNLMRAGLSRKDAERVKEDDVVTSPNLSFSPVISHEFTHRGFKLLKEERDKDPEAFDKKYGKNAGRILEYTKHRYPGGVGESTEEYYVEMFDDLDTRFNTTSLKVDQDFEKFPKSTVRGTVQGSYAGPTFDLKDYSPKEDAKRFEQIRGFQDKILHLRGMDKGILGLMDAAQDILTEQGEPPKFKKQTKSFFEKIFNFSEGGLAGQTNAVFGTSSEDMSPQDYAQSYMEGLGITPMKDLGGLEGITFKDAATFVAEATPIIGDAIAAKEVYDELRKENPNYLLVGALGGAALIGLIPGLGDAAAASIRKGARTALDTSKRIIPTKKVDDVYNPVIDGDGSYDPIVEKYLTPVQPTEKVGTSIPKINMIEGSAAGINNKTVTQSAVDLMDEPAFGEGFAEKLQQVAAENSIAVGDKTFMPMDVYTELFDRVNNPEFKIVQPVEKYLNQEPEELLALALKKNPSETDEQLIKDINKKIADKDIAELQAQKDFGLFDNEADLIMAHGKGVLSTPEYFRAKSDFIESKLNSLDPSDPKYKEYEKFSDVYSSIDLATLLDFARKYPVAPDIATGMQYEKFAADVKKYDSGLVEFADDIGLDPNDFIDVVQDAIPFVGDSVFPDYLPRAIDSGDIYPRKATDYTQSNTESLLAKIPTKTDRAASKLGFDDTVYHLAVSEDEFTKFKNVDDLIPEVRDGPTNKFQGTPHDLLGVHVGTARAAAERFRAKSVDFTESPRYTMQLRAKLDKPVRVEDVSEIIGFDPLKLQLDDSGLNFTEQDLRTIIKQKAIQKNITGEYVSTSMENQAAIELRKELADSGFTHIPYVNELEDKDSISYIMLVDRKKGDPAVLRDYNAKFDPEEAASTDLRMFGGGLSQ